MSQAFSFAHKLALTLMQCFSKNVVNRKSPVPLLGGRAQGLSSSDLYFTITFVAFPLTTMMFSPRCILAIFTPLRL